LDLSKTKQNTSSLQYPDPETVLKGCFCSFWGLKLSFHFSSIEHGDVQYAVRYRVFVCLSVKFLGLYLDLRTNLGDLSTFGKVTEIFLGSVKFL
jgi:hypothetical protein